MTRKSRLFFVVGPSAAGKDSVVAYARARLAAGTPVAFAHRYITRMADAGGENHVALSEDEFRARLSRGLFALHWQGHDLSYGVGCEIDFWMKAGLDVVVVGARRAVGQAAAAYPTLVPVVIQADVEILKARLEARGRETPEQIFERLTEAKRFKVEHAAVEKIDNSGPLKDAGEAFLNLITRGYM